MICRLGFNVIIRFRLKKEVNFFWIFKNCNVVIWYVKSYEFVVKYDVILLCIGVDLEIYLNGCEKKI